MVARVARPHPHRRHRRPWRRRPLRRERRARGRRRLVGLTTLVLVVGARPDPAEAGGGINALGDFFRGLILLVTAELLIPDYRYEWGRGTQDAHTTLAWPLPISLGMLDLGDHVTVALEARGELQYRPNRGERWSLGGRLPVLFSDGRHDRVGRNLDRPFPGLFVEAAMLGGDEGRGTVLGGGLMFGNPVWAFMLGYQNLRLDDYGRRHAVGLDFHLALPVAGLGH